MPGYRIDFAPILGGSKWEEAREVIVLAVLRADGSELAHATYLGGSGGEQPSSRFS